MIKIVKYNKDYKQDWDKIISKTSNGTFLHLRNFMDYHADRFKDYSLMFYKGERLLGVLPAHTINNEIYSHFGLTYGDFLFDNKLKLEQKEQIIKSALSYLSSKGFKKIYIKTVPTLFQKNEDESNIYFYNQLEGKINKILPYFFTNKFTFSLNNSRKGSIRKAITYDISIFEDNNYISDFWKIVEDNLLKNHKTKPVHSLIEISLLISKFPKNIKLYVAKKDDKILAGTLIFVVNKTLHFQYIQSTTDRNYRTAIDLLVYEVVKKNIDKFKYISFGSSEKGEALLSKGLSFWKESFGSKIINQYFFEIDLEKINFEKEILI